MNIEELKALVANDQDDDAIDMVLLDEELGEQWANYIVDDYAASAMTITDDQLTTQMECGYLFRDFLNSL